MEIALLVLVLQIGFNTALNNRGYNSNPVIPSPHFINSGQTRRLPETDSHLQRSSRGLPESDEQSDSGYSSSFEDYSYRSVRPLQSRSNPRKKYYLRNSPAGRINSNNQVESLTSNSYLRQPYLRNGVSNLRPDQTSQNYRKANDDSSIEISSLESSNPEDVSRLGEEATYLRSLMSLIEQPNNRRGQNRKYYRQGNSLSIDGSPLDKFDVDEDNLLNSLNNRRNNNPDANVHSILLVTDDERDEIPMGNTKLKSLEPISLPYNKQFNIRYDDGLNLDKNITNNMLPFRGPKQRPRDQKFEKYDPMTRRFNRKSNNNAGLELPLNDNIGKVTVLRLASLEDLNLESPLLSSSNYRKNNDLNFLRLSLSPDNKLTLDEGMASDLSKILSETLDGLHLAPVNLRRTDLPNNKYSRRKNNRLNIEENNLRLGSLHIPKPASPLRRYRGLANHSSSRSVKTHGNHTRQVLKKLFDEATAKTPVPVLRTHGNHTRQVHKNLFDEDTPKALVPYHEGKFPNNNNRKDDGWPDEFSLDTLFAFRKENNFSDDLTKNQNNLSLELPPQRSSDEILPKDDDVLHLEFPWNDALSPDSAKAKSKLRTDEKKDNSKDDTLHLDFPWNDQLSPNADKEKSQLTSDDKKDKSNDTTDALLLEFPWNDVLGPDGDKSKSLLRIDDKDKETKNETDTLKLEFPWNDALSPDGNKNKSQSRTDEKKDNSKDATDTLHLDFPWNESLSPDGDKVKLLLRSDDQKDNTTDTVDTLELEFPWNDSLSPDKGKQQLSSKDDTNDKLSPDENKTVALFRSETDRQDKEPKDELKLEFPWNGQTSPDKPSSQKTIRIPDPFYVHPYLRNRNVNKHPNYFRQIYDEFIEGVRLENLKNRRSDSHRRQSKRRRYDDLEVIGLTRRSSEEDLSDLITLPTDRRPHRLASKENTPPLVTTTFKPKHSSVKNGNKSDGQTNNETIVFPKN